MIWKRLCPGRAESREREQRDEAQNGFNEWQQFGCRSNTKAGIMQKVAVIQTASLISVCPGFTRVKTTGFIAMPSFPAPSIVTLV